MILIKIFFITILIGTGLNSSKSFEDYCIGKTNEQFNLINDYKVDMVIRLEIPAFRMPKKKYKVFYKKPNQIKVKAKGFVILPKSGLFTSPNLNFFLIIKIIISAII